MKSFKEYLKEAKDYFTGSEFSNEKGDQWNVEDVIEFAKSDPSYLHKNYPIDEIKNQLSWWEDNKEQRKRMKKIIKTLKDVGAPTTAKQIGLKSDMRRQQVLQFHQQQNLQQVIFQVLQFVQPNQVLCFAKYFWKNLHPPFY